jgi:enoyl-CoA hydratase
LHALFLFPKLTIAQVHGHAVAGGMYLAMFCDFLVCADDAKIGATEQRLGFAGGGAVIFPHLVYTVGLKRANDLFITGKVISGKEAADIGLATKSVPPEKLDEEVQNLAKTLAIQPRDGIAIGKAHRHLCYDVMGLSTVPTVSYVMHTLFTNLQYEPDEWIFFKERRDKGTKAAFHERDKMFDSTMSGESKSE